MSEKTLVKKVRKYYTKQWNEAIKDTNAADDDIKDFKLQLQFVDEIKNFEDVQEYITLIESNEGISTLCKILTNFN